MSSRPRPDTRGAAAVEFALVAPVLVGLTLVIIAFGHAYFVQSSLSNAARDAVRVMALQDTTNGQDPVTLAKQRAVASAAPAVQITVQNVKVTLGTSTVDVAPKTKCAAADSTAPTTATVIITYDLKYPGGIRLPGSGSDGLRLTGKGTMRCNG